VSPVTGTSVSKHALETHAEMLADKLAKTQKDISKQVFK
jgi:predicted ATP-grasp superfamily ATP-dependent carboligase